MKYLSTLIQVSLLCSAPLACGSEGASHGSESEDGTTQVDAGPSTRRDAAPDTVRDAAKNTREEDASLATPTDPDTCAAISKTAPVVRGKVDVIWLVDNSPSMLDKIVQLSANIGSFFSTIEQSGADTRVITLSLADLAAGTPLGNDADKYRFVPANVWSKLVYASATMGFSQYQDFLRAGASTHFVVVSDDDDLQAPADFKSEMEGLLGHSFTLHAIVAEEFGCGSAVGSNYMDCADLTMGKKISICSQDWTQVFGDLQSAVIEAVPLPCSYALTDLASSTSDYDPSKVQVVYTAADRPDGRELPKSTDMSQCAAEPGWFYDDEKAPSQISLCPAACELVKQGGAMNIAFGCRPTVFL